MSRFKPLTVIALALTTLLAAHDPGTAQQRKFLSNLSSAAIERTQHAVRYDPAYVRLAYPGGDTTCWGLILTG